MTHTLTWEAFYPHHQKKLYALPEGHRLLVQARCESEVIAQLFSEDKITKAAILDPLNNACNLALSRSDDQNVSSLYLAGFLPARYLCEVTEGAFKKVQRILAKPMIVTVIERKRYTIDELVQQSSSESSALFKRLSLVQRIQDHKFAPNVSMSVDRLIGADLAVLQRTLSRLDFLQKIIDHPKYDCLHKRGILSFDRLLQEDSTSLARIAKRLDRPYIVQCLPIPQGHQGHPGREGTLNYDDLKKPDDAFGTLYPVRHPVSGYLYPRPPQACASETLPSTPAGTTLHIASRHQRQRSVEVC